MCNESVVLNLYSKVIIFIYVNNNNYIKKMNKENSPVPKRSFPTIRNTMVLSNKDNNHLKMNSMNYFNKTTGVLFNMNKKRASIRLKDEVAKGSHMPEIVKIKARTSNINVYNHRALIPLQNKKEDNSDSFITELEDLLTNVNNNEDAKSSNEEEPDPRINFEKINELNKARPQTSYGGMNQRRKKLQIALKSAKYRPNDNNKVSNDKDIC